MRMRFWVKQIGFNFFLKKDRNDFSLFLWKRRHKRGKCRENPLSTIHGKYIILPTKAQRISSMFKIKQIRTPQTLLKAYLFIGVEFLQGKKGIKRYRKWENKKIKYY